VTETWCIRGRRLEAGDLAQIRGLLAAHPTWSRRRLSEELTRLWDWRTPTGQLKDIAARDLLNRLEARGLITLPPRQRRGGRQVPRARRAPDPPGVPWPRVEAAGSAGVSELVPLSWHLAPAGDPQRAQIARYLSQHHYLGYPDPLGQLHYLVRDRQGRDLACLLFGPAAWTVAARDAFIGWSPRQRQARLGHLANNSRFLLLPWWVQVPGLASHVLAAAVRRVRVDWPAQHGRALWLVETFVEAERFAGTCYRAANWLCVGSTRGRTRNDRWHRRDTPRKQVFLFSMAADFRHRLCAP